MPKRSLLRHIFRHGSRAQGSEDALTNDKQQATAVLDTPGIDNDQDNDPSLHKDESLKRPSSPLSPRETPEPFRLEGIVEEDVANTPPSTETASLSDSLDTPSLELTTFSTHDLVYAVLQEAKIAASSHLDTINTTLALLEALDGFSATIETLVREMVEKKQACEERIAMLHAVERAVEDVVFAGEAQEGD